MPLEILHGAFVLFGRRARFESAEIAPFAGPGVHFAGIKPVFARLQFADHGTHLAWPVLPVNRNGAGPFPDMANFRASEFEPAGARGRPRSMFPSISNSAMTEVDKIIAEAARLPLKDAAYALWRQSPRLDTLEGQPMTADEHAAAAARPMAEIMEKMKHDHDHAEDGRTFGRLKRAHPQASDADAKTAIIAAVKFDDDCFRYFDEGRGDFGERIERAVELAAKKSPGYLQRTYQRAKYYIGYYMK
jgi:hypothetical protein